MPFDPISYSLAKKKSEAVINSTSPPEINKFWYDVNSGVLRGYDFKNGEWKFLSKYGYDDFDNPGYGGWGLNIQIPISTSPSESVQYCIEINGDNIYVKSNDLTKNLVSGTGGTTFWQNVSGINDIRVFDENYTQNYFWIEEFDTANQVCKIWVKLNAGQTMVGIAFGNPYAGVSSYHNGDMTFEFFDDFDGTSLDKNVWTVYLSPSITVSNSIVSMSVDSSNNCGGFYSRLNLPTDIVVNLKMKMTSGGDDSTLYFGNSKPGTSGSGYLFHMCDSKNTVTRIDYGWWGVTELISSSDSCSLNVWHKYTHVIASNHLTVIKDGRYLCGYSGNVSESPTYIGIHQWSGVTWDYDWIIIRKYVSSDLSFGTPKVDTF